MLAKLLALIAQGKGAGLAVVLIASATTVTVASTTPELQDAVQQLTANIGLSSQRDCGDGQGQPAVVAQRNAADKLLRDAWNKDHKMLEDLRGGKDVDNKAVGEIVKKYDDQLRDTLNTALNDVAALTLGREGQVRKAEASASSSASASPSISPSVSPSASGTTSTTPTCPPKPSGSAAAKPSESAKPSGSGKPDEQGRVAVANRTTLDAAIQSIVDKAIKDMADLVTKATDEAGKVPPAEHGKPSDNPGNKPEDKGKPSGNPGNGNKPSNRP
jgi:hypothetical protein